MFKINSAYYRLDTNSIYVSSSDSFIKLSITTTLSSSLLFDVSYQIDILISPMTFTYKFLDFFATLSSHNIFLGGDSSSGSFTIGVIDLFTEPTTQTFTKEFLKVTDSAGNIKLYDMRHSSSLAVMCLYKNLLANQMRLLTLYFNNGGPSRSH